MLELPAWQYKACFTGNRLLLTYVQLCIVHIHAYGLCKLVGVATANDEARVDTHTYVAEAECHLCITSVPIPKDCVCSHGGSDSCDSSES